MTKEGRSSERSPVRPAHRRGLLIRVRGQPGRTGRVDVVLGHLPGRQGADRVDHRLGGVGGLVVAQRRDRHRLIVDADRVGPGAHLIQRPVATLVPGAELVDEEVVPDVAPAQGLGLVQVDRPHLGAGLLLGVGVRGGRVVDDHGLGLDPGAEVLADRLVRTPAGTRHDRDPELVHLGARQVRVRRLHSRLLPVQLERARVDQRQTGVLGRGAVRGDQAGLNPVGTVADQGLRSHPTVDHGGAVVDLQGLPLTEARALLGPDQHLGHLRTVSVPGDPSRHEGSGVREAQGVAVEVELLTVHALGLACCRLRCGLGLFGRARCGLAVSVVCLDPLDRFGGSGGRQDDCGRQDHGHSGLGHGGGDHDVAPRPVLCVSTQPVRPCCAPKPRVMLTRALPDDTLRTPRALSC